MLNISRLEICTKEEGKIKKCTANSDENLCASSTDTDALSGTRHQYLFSNQDEVSLNGRVRPIDKVDLNRLRGCKEGRIRLITTAEAVLKPVFGASRFLLQIHLASNTQGSMSLDSK